MTLREAKEGQVYTVKKINVDDKELSDFLFSLGCYRGEAITVISRRKGGCIVYIKNGRYSIDMQLADAIAV